MPWLLKFSYLIITVNTMTKGKILITETTDQLLIAGLKEMGYSCNYEPGISQSGVAAIIHDYTGIVVATRIVVNRQLLQSATQLKFVARAGSGMENIDTLFAAGKNITCINSPEGNANAVGEHALGLLLAFFHNIVKSNAEISQHKWLVQENRVHELEGRTVGIIGYGNTGKSFAKKLSSLGMKVMAYDKYLDKYSDHYALEAGMESIFEEAEIVSLHIPLTTISIRMVDEKFLQQFKKKIFLINTARGNLIVHRALLHHIEQGMMMGAALDVYENEDFDSHSSSEEQVFKGLMATGKVIVTPHIAGKSFESPGKIALALLDKISRMF